MAAEDFKSEGEQRIPGKYRESFVELLMARWLAATEIVVIHRGQIVMNQRISMDHFDRRCDRQHRLPVILIRSERRHTKTRPDALAAIHRAVSHGLMNPRRDHRFCGKQLIERGIDGRPDPLKKGRQIAIDYRLQTEPPGVVLNCFSAESPRASRPVPALYGKGATT